MTKERELSVIENIKVGSRCLRGTIAEELNSAQPGFSETNAQLLKFHGIIQHDDRDTRLERRENGLAKHYEFTVRVRATGGKIAADQMAGLIDLTDQLQLGALRITSRQGIQLTQLNKGCLKEVIQRIAGLGLTTFSSAGDVNCNVMCCPSPGGKVKQQMFSLANEIGAALMPDDQAYREVWLSNDPTQRDSSEQATHDQLYGESYLPHKFKVGLALPDDNCVDVYAQDIGLLAVCEGDRIVGYDMVIGGGMGMIPSAPGSFRALAQPFAFATPENVLDTILAALAVYRDLGNRTSRSKARLKYMVHSWGVEEFRRKVEQCSGKVLGSPRGTVVTGREDHLGWHLQDDGRLVLGLPVESGRIGGKSCLQLPTAVREIVTRFGVTVCMTPQQNLVLRDIEESTRADIDAILEQHGVPHVESLSEVRRGATACPALPNCRSAITEAERIVPDVLAQLEAELERLGLSEERCTLSVTGCSSGCARCFLSDIAVVGRTLDARRKIDKFAIYVGGDHFGQRLNRLYIDLVPIHQVVTALRPLLEHFQQERRPDETLGEFFNRTEVADLPPIPTFNSERDVDIA